MVFLEYLQVVLTLLAVLVGMFFLLRFSRVVQGKKFSGEIKVLDRRAVDASVTLMVVRVRNEEFLISVANKNLAVIKQYPSESNDEASA